MTGTDLTTIDFHGATLVAKRGPTPAETLVAMKPVVEGMGLDWSFQRKKLVGHPVLKQGVAVIAIPSEGGPQEMTALPLNRLNFWLATIHPDRVKDPEARDLVITYQVECADALFEHFFPAHPGARDLTPDVVGGVFKGVLTKHDRSVLMPAMKAEMLETMREVLPRMVEAAMAADPRRTVENYIAPLEVAIQHDVPSKGRRNFVTRMGNQMARISAAWVIPVTLSPENKRRMFSREVVAYWLDRGGRDLIRAHKASLAGQGELPLEEEKKRGRKPAPKAVSEIAESCAEDVFEQAMQAPKDMREHVARFGARAAAAIAARNIVGHDVKAFETLVLETVLKRIREAA